MTDGSGPGLPSRVRHDDLFRALMEDPARAGTLIRETLPAALAARLTDTPPKLLDGTFIDGEARATQSDRLFEVRLTGDHPAFVFTLFEHKSAADPATPLQILGYMCRIWTRFAQGRAGRLRTLPVIVPLVYFNGASAWNVPEVFADMVLCDEDTAEFVPSFRYGVRDLGAGPVEALSGDAELRSGLAALRFALRSRDATPRDLALIFSGLCDGTGLERIVFRYIYERYDVAEQDLRSALDVAKSDGGKVLMGTLAEKWWNEGLAEGKAEGKAEGMQAGEQLGLAKGKAEGKAEGMQAGEQLGLAKGKADTLRTLLVRRFGPLPDHARARIDGASLAELDAWLDAVLDADSPDAVFGSGRA